jgi:hypothetical protein
MSEKPGDAILAAPSLRNQAIGSSSIGRLVRRRMPRGSKSSPALEWVGWFNNRRILGLIGNISPTTAEGRDYAMLDEGRIAA